MVTAVPWWPRATRRPVTYAPEAGRFDRAPLGWVLHVTCMDGSPWATFEHAQPPNRRFSHLWIGKSGQVEQYAPLTFKSWAQGPGGNGSYWSVETDGSPREPLTEAQIAVLAEWHAWSGTLDALASRPGDPGIGTHAMGGPDWGNHTCPDPAPGLPGPRSRQRADIVAAARGLRTHQEAPVTVPTPSENAEAVWGPGSPFVVRVKDPTDGELTLKDGSPAIAPITALAWTLYAVQDLQASVAALAEQVKTLRTGGIDVDQLATAVAARIPAVTASEVKTALAEVLRTVQP